MEVKKLTPSLGSRSVVELQAAVSPVNLRRDDRPPRPVNHIRRQNACSSRSEIVRHNHLTTAQHYRCKKIIQQVSRLVYEQSCHSQYCDPFCCS